MDNITLWWVWLSRHIDINIDSHKNKSILFTMSLILSLLVDVKGMLGYELMELTPRASQIIFEVQEIFQAFGPYMWRPESNI